MLFKNYVLVNCQKNINLFSPCVYYLKRVYILMLLKHFLSNFLVEIGKDNAAVIGIKPIKYLNYRILLLQLNFSENLYFTTIFAGRNPEILFCKVVSTFNCF